MPNMMIKNVPQDLYDKLKQSAQEHHRSINSEVIVSLEKVLRSTRVDPEEFLRKVHELQQRFTVPPLTDEFLRAAKEDGRP